MIRTRRGPAPAGTGPEKIATADGVLFDVEATADTRQATPAQVRRRRAAADRCEPMADGRRDPFDASRADGRRVHIEVGRRSAWLHGRGLHAAVDKLRIPSMWCPYARCLTVPVDRVDDLLAFLEHRQRRHVTVQAVDR